MTWHDDDLVRKRQELTSNGVDNFRERAAPQIRATNAAGKKRIAREHSWGGLIHNEANATRRMPRCVQHMKPAATDIETLIFYQ